MKAKEIIEQLQEFDGDMDVVLFFNAGDDVFYEEAGNVREAYLDPIQPYCYTSIDEVKEDYGDTDVDIADLEKVIAILA